MPGFEIHGRDVAHSVCLALLATAELGEGEVLALATPGRFPAPWSVEIQPGADAIHFTAYGAGDEDPQCLDSLILPYLDGPQIMMLDEGYCGRVVEVAQRALDIVTAARGGDDG